MSIHIADKSYLVRGYDKGTTIPAKLIDMLKESKGTLDYHSHPFIGDLRPSKEDRALLALLTWQEESITIDAKQSAVTFTVHGTKEKFKATENYTDDYWAELF